MPILEPISLSSDQRAVIGSLMSLRFGSPTEESRLSFDAPRRDDASESLQVYRHVLGPDYCEASRGK